ncbi:dual specificity protein phosphatase CDC14A-like [Macrosteles quadrilineatus]|uniref:dual specificity protein phosphatase CDC14A-like n=1 Tax=Macrosteles quadrilineatus TaxID=74068 RepID=UPI0023E1291C|nr:dual specificity protein phosphatase CDC14A-like [Macrosteles quadrilineatus]XP_054290828.1 dual specificity protein phosphatase CDC14A-like [Macrosteles quadrilineatus]
MSLKVELEADKHTQHVAEFIKDRLYFATFRNKTHRNTTGVHYFTVDDELVYNNYYGDFGPLSLSSVVRFLNKVNFKLKSPSLASKILVQYTSPNEKKRANAAFLMAVYAIVHLDMSPLEAYSRLSSTKHPFLSFQDATVGDSKYRIRLIDCLNAVRKAIYFGIVNFNDFNLDEYEKMDNVKNGDVSWIVPQKFLAFSGPVDKPTEDCYHAPEYYINYFRDNNVKTVIRLNVKMYNALSFTNAGLAHYDLYFVDGSVPSHDILQRFFDISENTAGAVAVHCKAGLGRTGCLIGAYLVKHYRMTALEAISWLRICRPGCIIGYQQSWLEELEPSLWNWGDAFRLQYHGGANRIPHHKFGIYSHRASKKRGAETEPEYLHETEQTTPMDVDHRSCIHSVISNLPKTLTSESFGETQGDKLNSIKKWRDMQHIMSHKPKTVKTVKAVKLTKK